MLVLANLPPLAPDQTLYSWSGLTHAWNGLSPVATSEQLFNSRSAAFLHDFPGHLAALEQSTSGKLGPVRALALRHTLLGYFLPLASAGFGEVVLRLVHEKSMPDLKMRLGITASRIGGHHPLKGCPKCFEEDQATVGFAYWHVAHQFPSVVVCEAHQRPLTIAWDPVTPVHRRGWLLPTSGLAREWLPVQLANDQQIARLLRLAIFSRHFGHLDPSSLDPAHLATTYQTALKGLGLVTQGGSLRLPALVSLTRTRYHGLETIPGFEVLQAVTSDWPGLAASLTRKCPRPGHPLKHLLLMAMLFERWEDFWMAYRAFPGADEETVPATAEGAETEPRDRLALLLATGLSIRSASAKSGISTTTGVKWAKQLNVSFTPRAKTFTVEKQNKAKQMLKAGRDIVFVSASLAVSHQSVRRLLVADRSLLEAWNAMRLLAHRNQARARFVTIVNQNPRLTVKALRRVPNNCYMWLYRHDRMWLSDHSAVARQLIASVDPTCPSP